MNLNEFAQRIAQLEGKKVALSIAQIKEVMRCAGMVLAGFGVDTSVALDLCAQIVKRGEKALDEAKA